MGHRSCCSDHAQFEGLLKLSGLLRTFGTWQKEVKSQSGNRSEGGNRASGLSMQRGRVPAGLAAAAPCAHVGSGCQIRGSVAGSASAPSPRQHASLPSAPRPRTRWSSSLAPAAEHYKVWLPAPGFSNATQITYKTVSRLNTESQHNTAKSNSNTKASEKAACRVREHTAAAGRQPLRQQRHRKGTQNSLHTGQAL